MLALQVELCSPRLIASRVEARWSPSGFRPGFWPQGQSSQSTPLHRLPRVLPDPARLGRLVEPEPLAELRHEGRHRATLRPSHEARVARHRFEKPCDWPATCL